MEWFVYAIAAAIFSAFFQISRKKALQKVHAVNFESVRTIFVVLISLSLLPFIDWKFDSSSIGIVYVVSLLAAVGIICAAKAYRHNNISLINPLSNFKPAFTAIIAFFFLSEKIALKEVLGIAIILLSAYILQSDHKFSNLIKPLKELHKSIYTWMFIFAMLLFALSNTLDKYIITYLIPDYFTYFIVVWFFIALNLNIIHYFLYGFRDSIDCFKQTTYLPVLAAFFSFGSNLLIFKALSMQYVSLVIPIVLLSTLLVVIFGGKYFHEKNLIFRMIISIFMLIGVYLIII